MGIETALLLPLLSAGVTMYNTNRTAKKQDRALAESIRNQSTKRREQEARVNDEVNKLRESTSSDERSKRLSDYTDMLRKRNGEITAGLGGGGGETFNKASAEGKTGVIDYGAELAGLMSRIDAPTDQRRGEGVSFGNLGIDLDNTSREAQGKAYLDKLRYDRIRRNPWLDAAASFAMGYTPAASGGALPSGIMSNGMTANVVPKKLGNSVGGFIA
jgi:hypothetical protein